MYIYRYTCRMQINIYIYILYKHTHTHIHNIYIYIYICACVLHMYIYVYIYIYMYICIYIYIYVSIIYAWVSFYVQGCAASAGFQSEQNVLLLPSRRGFLCFLGRMRWTKFRRSTMCWERHLLISWRANSKGRKSGYGREQLGREARFFRRGFFFELLLHRKKLGQCVQDDV